ncbi:MAG: hypothetical protein NVS1B7_6920 [Candidatus Saccharimonadales bacterium]
MALSRGKKDEVVAEVSGLLADSKMTVIAAYQGTPVKAMQNLRREARTNGTRVQVVKNRLVIKALQSNDKLKGADTTALNGMLLYAFNNDDEVAPAQILEKFSRTQPTLSFIGAINADGTFLSADEVKGLAILPSKNELIAQVLATLASPVNDVMNGLSGNLHALLDGIEAQAAA